MEEKKSSKKHVKPKIFMRSEKQFTHHLFIGSTENCLKNSSFRKDQPNLHQMPHKHFFHTVDKYGTKQSTCTPALGHYHQVTWEHTAQGDLVAISGPAITDVKRVLADGSEETVPERVRYKTLRGEEIQDTHTHEWEYDGSEVLSRESQNRYVSNSRAEMVAAGYDIQPNLKSDIPEEIQ